MFPVDCCLLSNYTINSKVKLTVDSINAELLHQCQRRLSEALTTGRVPSNSRERLTAFSTTTNR